MSRKRDHGGGLDAAAARWGGTRGDWLDLSTGINPVPYPLPPIAPEAWTALPDTGAEAALVVAARALWRVPAGAGVLCAPGVSVLIAAIPRLVAPARVRIAGPTYNEHAAGFAAEGWQVCGDGDALAQVVVHPNNPDGRRWSRDTVLGGHRRLSVIDESFCDICPEASLIDLAARPGVVVLKGLGKFWGLAGVRLGFAIAAPATIDRLRQMIGPWAVSGPALAVGAAALGDADWAAQARDRLARDAARLDAMMTGAGARDPRGTTLFRLYDMDDAAAVRDRLARHRIWSRVFPWSPRALRLGLPGTAAEWARLGKALEER